MVRGLAPSTAPCCAFASRCEDHAHPNTVAIWRHLFSNLRERNPETHATHMEYLRSAGPEHLASVCSGTECPVLCLEGLTACAPGYNVVCDYSCEKDMAKNEMLQALYPSHSRFFGDIHELLGQKATNHKTGIKMPIRETPVH